MRYTLIGALHLNRYAVGGPDSSELFSSDSVSSLKRKRILKRITEGYTQNKRRRFPYSR